MSRSAAATEEDKGDVDKGVGEGESNDDTGEIGATTTPLVEVTVGIVLLVDGEHDPSTTDAPLLLLPVKVAASPVSLPHRPRAHVDVVITRIVDKGASLGSNSSNQHAFLSFS
jgi:hypothetical protein